MRLDSADLKDRLVEQTIAAKRAENEYQAAHLAHDLAIMASKQYKESSYLLEKGAIQGEIKRAESNLTSTSDQLEHTTRGFEKGMVTKAQKVAIELALQKAKYDFELAQSKLNNLEQYTKPLAVKRLSSEIDKARSQEQAAKEISGAAAKPGGTDPPPNRELQAEGPERRSAGHCTASAPTWRRHRAGAGPAW